MGSLVGSSVERKEDKRFLTGKGRYTADRNINNQTYAVFVRSPHARAKIKKVDISKASNFERFIFDLIGREASILRDYWKQIDSGGSFQIDKETMKKVLAFGFISSSSKHENRIKLIKQFYAEYDVIIDTHTADGVKASLDHLSEDTPMLVLETALPIKFEKSVLEAIGKKPTRPEALVGLEEINQRFKILENKTSLIKDFILAKK